MQRAHRMYSTIPGGPALWLAALLLLCGGCSKRDRGKDLALADAGKGDSGMTDYDASTDGGAISLGEGSIILGADGRELCGFDDTDVLSIEVGAGRLAADTIAVGEQMALAYLDLDGALQLVAVPPEGAFGDAARVVPSGATPRAPQLVATDGGLLLLWQTPSDGGAGRMQLWARSLDDAALGAQALGQLPADAPRLPGTAGHVDSYVVAFVPDGESMADVLRLDAQGAPVGNGIGLAHGVAGTARAVELARLDDGATLAAWLEPDGDAFKVMGQVLDADLKPVAMPQALSGGPVQDAPFALAGRQGSGGVIYRARELERDALKFHRVALDGSVEGPLLNVVAAPGRATDQAIASFGQGYAVAYRALPSPGVENPGVRVTFIDQRGKVVHDALLAETSEDGGPTSVAATPDGHLLVTWRTVAPSGRVDQTVQRLYCPGALVLCGGHSG